MIDQARSSPATTMIPSTASKPPTLRTIFCEIHRCRPEEFVNKVFWLSVHRRVLPFVALIKLLWPGFFRSDYELIEDAGHATRVNEILLVVNNYRNDCQRERRFFHDQLRWRISGRRLYMMFARIREKYDRLNAAPSA
jgi:hypothetical protein